MGRTKTSALQLTIFEKPPYYEHEVITNLEELSLTSSQSAKELNKNFQNISDTLYNASNNVVSSIENEAEKSRIQASMQSERIASGISETNYRLLDVANGMEELDNSIYNSSMVIEEAISDSSKEISRKLEEGNTKLKSIDLGITLANIELGNISNKLDVLTDIVSRSLAIISSQLGDLIKKISTPNETEALELANQARQNIALDKKEIALNVTEKALNLSNGTSITVLAYHILTLSLFEDEESIEDMKNYYIDYVKLVGFKLTDNFSDEEIILEEINSTVYSVMAVMGHRLDSNVILMTEKLYRYLIGSKTSYILKKPLYDKNTLKLITYTNHLRELHWSILLKNTVLLSNDIDIFVRFITSLMENKVLIKNEILYIVSKKFYKKQFLKTIITSKEIQNSNGVMDILELISSILPEKTLLVNKESLENIHKLNDILNYINFLSISKIVNKDELITQVILYCNNNSFLYSIFIDGLAATKSNTRNNAIKIILSLLPQNIIEIDNKTYWAMNLCAKKYGIGINISLESKFIEASQYVKSDLEENYITFFDNAQEEMYIEENEIIPKIEAIRKEHLEVSKKKTEELEKYNCTIENNKYEERINNNKLEIDHLKGRSFLGIAGGIVWGMYFLFLFGGFYVISLTKSGLEFLITLVIALAGYIILGALVADWKIREELASNFVSFFQKKIDKYKEENKKYKKELDKKYNINKEKEKIDTLYNEKISTLSKQLKMYKQKKIDNLTLKFDSLISKYIPSNLEQLSMSEDEIKKCIDERILENIVSFKRPNDLKFKKFR